MSNLEVFAAYGPRGPRRPVDCSNDLPLTVQSAREECDINRIVASFQRTGVLPPMVDVGQYVDVSAVGDLREQMERVRGAREYFETLPAVMRERYGNDPVVFFESISEDDAVELGWIEKPEVPNEVPANPPA